MRPGRGCQAVFGAKPRRGSGGVFPVFNLFAFGRVVVLSRHSHGRLDRRNAGRGDNAQHGRFHYALGLRRGLRRRILNLSGESSRHRRHDAGGRVLHHPVGERAHHALFDSGDQGNGRGRQCPGGERRRIPFGVVFRRVHVGIAQSSEPIPDPWRLGRIGRGAVFGQLGNLSRQLRGGGEHHLRQLRVGRNLRAVGRDGGVCAGLRLCNVIAACPHQRKRQHDRLSGRALLFHGHGDRGRHLPSAPDQVRARA